MTGTTIDGASNSFSASALVQEFSDDALKMLKQAGVSEIDATLVLGELSELAQTLVGKSTSTAQTAPAGAPSLEAPSEDFSADQLALIIGSMQNKISELQAKTAKEGIKISETQKQEAHQKAIEKIEEIAKKMAEAKAKSKLLGILNIFAKIFAVVAMIAAVAATVASGGAASPLLVASTALLVATTTLDTVLAIADKISTSAGGPSLTLDHLMTEAISKIAQACGANKEEADKIGQWTALAIQLAITIATLAAGVAGAVGKGASAAASVSGTVAKSVTATQQAVTTTAKATSAGASILGGVNTVASGGVSIAKAQDEKSAADAKANKAEIDKMILLLTKQMEDDQERVKKIVTELDEAMQQLSSLINSAGETRMQQIKNLV